MKLATSSINLYDGSNKFITQIQIFRTNDVEEYLKSNLKSYLSHHDTIHTKSCVDIPQQNGVAERKNVIS